jgi:hypothetical protein
MCCWAVEELGMTGMMMWMVVGFVMMEAAAAVVC